MQAGWGRASEKNSGFCPHFHLGGSCSSSPRSEARECTSSLTSLMIFKLLPQHRSSEQWVCQRGNPCTGPSRGTPGTPARSPRTQPNSLLAFTARSFGDLSSWRWDPSLLGGGLCSPDVPPPLFLSRYPVRMGPAPLASANLLPVSMWLLNILNYTGLLSR